MLVPVLAGVAALYGYYRYQKAKEASILTPTGYTTTPQVPSPVVMVGTTPVTKKAMSGILSAVTQAKAGLGAPLPVSYGKTATTADVPPGRIPSSLYGTAGTPGPTPVSADGGVSAGVSVSTDGGFSIKFP